MNNRAFVFILFLLFAFQSRSQQFFQRSYGGSGSDYGRSIITCTSGGYLVIGSSNSFFEPSTDVYFLRLNENGDYVWGENIGFENKIDWGFDIVESPEGIYYAVGYTNNTVDNSYDGMLISINDDGHVLDIHIFENEGWEFLYNMTTTEDSNLCVAGTKIGLSSHVGWVFKCDYSGNIIWESFISSENGNLKITGLDRCENGFFGFVGEVENPISGSITMVAGAIDQNGVLVWKNEFEQWENATVSRCRCIGNSDSPGIISVNTKIESPLNQLVVSNISAINGDVIWTRPEQGSLFKVNAINSVANGNILVAGERNVIGNGLTDGVSYVFDSNGFFISSDFAEVQGGFGTDVFYDIVPTADGGYICVGETNSFGNNWQVLVSKIAADGTSSQTGTDYLDITTSIEHPSNNQTSVVIYPNPSQSTINIRWNQAQLDAHFEIRALDGRMLMHGKYSDHISIEHLPNGSYVYLLLGKDGQVLTSLKFIKVY